MTIDQKVESQLVAKGLTAPRVTVDRINEVIAGEYYFRADEGVYGAAHNPMEGSQLPDNFRLGDTPLSLLTICVLVLRNGFTVTGESACASPENFDAEIGRQIARRNAEAKIWLLEGYLLKQTLSELGETK